jgi:predicted membrane protein DUF2306
VTMRQRAARSTSSLSSSGGGSPLSRDQRAGQPRGWPAPAALVALSAIPLAAGSLRLVQLAGGPDLMPADDRLTGFPAALVVHIVGAAAFALVGASQFVPRIRRGHPAWHRRAGRLVIAAGLAVAGSALWAIRRLARRRTRRHPRGTTTIHGAPVGAPT